MDMNVNMPGAYALRDWKHVVGGTLSVAIL
jgi:hypothetical protein